MIRGECLWLVIEISKILLRYCTRTLLATLKKVARMAMVVMTVVVVPSVVVDSCVNNRLAYATLFKLAGKLKKWLVVNRTTSDCSTAWNKQVLAVVWQVCPLTDDNVSMVSASVDRAAVPPSVVSVFEHWLAAHRAAAISPLPLSLVLCGARLCLGGTVWHHRGRLCHHTLRRSPLCPVACNVPEMAWKEEKLECSTVPASPC